MAGGMTTHEQNAALRAKIEELTEENRQLREAMYGELPLLSDLGLSAGQSRVLAALYRAQDLATNRALHVAQSRDGQALTDEKVVSIYILKLRRALAPHGIEIKSIWGKGYSLTSTSKQILRGLMNEREALALRAGGEQRVVSGAAR